MYEYTQTVLEKVMIQWNMVLWAFGIRKTLQGEMEANWCWALLPEEDLGSEKTPPDYS